MLETWALIDSLISQLKKNSKKLDVACTLLQYGSSVYLHRTYDRKPGDLDLCLVFSSAHQINAGTLYRVFHTLGIPLNRFFPDDIDLEDLRSNRIQQYGYYFTYKGLAVSLKICTTRIFDYVYPDSILTRVYRRKARNTLKKGRLYLQTTCGRVIDIPGDYRETRPGVIDSYTPGALSIQGSITYPYVMDSFNTAKKVFTNNSMQGQLYTTI